MYFLPYLTCLKQSLEKVMYQAISLDSNQNVLFLIALLAMLWKHSTGLLHYVVHCLNEYNEH